MLHGIAGPNTASAYRAMLTGLPVDLAGLTVGVAPTCTWHAVHDFERWTTSSEETEPGCDPEWQPRLTEAGRQAEVLFLASMDPAVQLEVLRQSNARLVGCDTMTVFIRAQRAAVLEVVASSDIAFLNHAELETLTGDRDWVTAAASLLGTGRTRVVVVKRGPAGAGLVSAGRWQTQPAVAVHAVVDPTGAGDALAGGLLGPCAARERDDDDALRAALANGVAAAAAAITSFGVEGLLSLVRAGRQDHV